MKHYVLTIFAIFGLSFWAGWQAPPSTAEDLMRELGAVVAPLVRQGPIVLVLVIFVNNALKALAAMLLGVTFGTLPVLFVAYNGYLVGAVMNSVADRVGAGTAFLALAPHGILELPAVFIACAYGIAIGWQAVLWVFRQGGQVRPILREGLRTYVRWIVPVLAVAAIVEVFVTPLVIRSVTGE